MSENNEPIIFTNQSSGSTFSNAPKQGITIDKVIEKFIPIVGTLFLTIGVAYLLYTSVWVHLDVMLRLGLGFFFSLALIGGAFSFSEKLHYFADLAIGAGVLLLYGTLIYGSRTTDLATAAVIPEIATLITAFIFTIAVAYFSSVRKSQAILVLGMLGSYITPFVIGQNDVWVQNISFNAYLSYFLAINVVIYLLGKEISVRNIIPLNVIGLFIGTSTLYHLSYSAGISKIVVNNFFTGEIFSAMLFFILVIFSIFSILISAKKFQESDDGYLALGYIAPVIWFIFNVGKLMDVPDFFKGILFAFIAAACFVGWHMIENAQTRFQHNALYAAGLLASVQAFFAFIPDLDIYSSIAISYSSLIFGIIFVLNDKKTERFFSYVLLSSIGSVLSLVYIFEKNIPFQTLYAVVSLIPAMLAFIIAKDANENIKGFSSKYSIFAAIIASMFVLKELVDYIDLSFLLFYLAPLLILIGSLFNNKKGHEYESLLLRLTLSWFALGFFEVFFSLVGDIYPAPTNTYILTHLNLPTDWILVKGIFATLILFTGLYISRKLQTEQVEKRPSFLLVIFGYASLLLIGNYIIYALANDFAVSMAHGGPRALATSSWWTLIALWMLIIGIKNGTRYHSEKLLGLILLALTVGKILLYDLSTMAMQNKIIILMIVGGALMLFSYGVHTKGWLKDQDQK